MLEKKKYSILLLLLHDTTVAALATLPACAWLFAFSVTRSIRRERERETDEDRCGEKQISSRFRVPLCLRIFPLILPCGPGWRGEETAGQASFGSARGTGKYGAALSCSAPLSSTCAEWAKRGGLPPEVSVKGRTVERSLWAVLLYKQCLSE